MSDSDIIYNFRNEWQGKLPEAIGLLEKVSFVLNKLEIHWSLISGTLLGSIRQNNIIPWDRDIDASIFNFERMEEIIKELGKIGIDCIKKDDGHRDLYYKIVYEESRNQMLNDRFPWVDLFQHIKLNDTTVRSFGHSRTLFTDVPINSWFPYSTGKLGNLSLPVPNEPKVYLNTLYPGWNEYGISSIGHKATMEELRRLELT